MTTSDTSTLTDEPLAHLGPDGRPHLLIEHLVAVGDLAARFAKRFDASSWARMAGRWHDLGKYSAVFQKMIREANGFEAHIEGDATGPRDHSSAGAIHALEQLGHKGLPIAFAVAGHHAGLANLPDLRLRCDRKRECLQTALRAGPAPFVLVPEASTEPAWLREGDNGLQRRKVEMLTRMLLSVLCDADFLDTERFYAPERSALRKVASPLAELKGSLDAFLRNLGDSAADTEVNRVRAEVLAACRATASQPPGVFTLTVPTGGGKTLASMAFALEHAIANGLDRVIVAIPYTSIIEQSAAVYRAALGDHAVVEHHSALDPSRETPRNRVAVENWDAPVVVTTTVQLLESLLANRPRACRKIHRLARSVVVIDEAQTLPPGQLAPILDVLRGLVDDFGATLVVSTATQPAFVRAPWLPVGFERSMEIVPQDVNVFDRLRRVRVRWPVSDVPTTYEALADEIAAESDVLAIVHRRDDARALCELLDQRLGHAETFHLSALMCAEHRTRVLEEIKAQKSSGRPVRLVATQLVEAGVDLDFAVVYRALGGLDALAQAAGRCNREGLRASGELRVFLAQTKPPRGVPEAALAVTQGLLRRQVELDLFSPSSFAEYFRQLYATRDLDAKRVQEARARLLFKDVAERFRLIEDDWSAPIIVPYGQALDRVAAVESAGPSRERLRGLQRFIVTIPRTLLGPWVDRGLLREVAETVYVLDSTFASAYDARFGLVLGRVGVADAASLVVDG